MKIKSLAARTILDSRGQWTVEASLTLAGGESATASVPQGKSTGSSEAIALSAEKAVHAIQRIIAPKLCGSYVARQATLDDLLIKLDGTTQKKKLGANAILATSIAYLRANAMANRIPLWRQINREYGLPVAKLGTLTHPRLFVNVINGGLHAGNNLNFQEYLIIPRGKTLRESVEIATAVYKALGLALAASKGSTAMNIGDEGGYAPNFKDNLEPFRVLVAVIKKMRLEKKVDIGMDAAATAAKLSERKLNNFYETFISRYQPIYLEDPFPEDRFEAFASLSAAYAPGKNRDLWIAGDDLTTTNVRLMERAHQARSVNAVIIKPNQIGTVTESLDAVRAARRYGWRVVASHRSGETNDTFIADFAYGVGADGLKLGAPARGERIAKYNRLLEIENGG